MKAIIQTKNRISKFLSIFIFFAGMIMVPAGVFAQTTQTIIETKNLQSGTQEALTQEVQQTNCKFAAVDKPEFSGRFLAVRRKAGVQPGEIFTMQVFIQNTGNIPWFSADSGCNSMTVVSLGTAKEHDRISPFYTDLPNPDTSKKNTWLGGSRIAMDKKRVSPLDVASFTITAQAPNDPGIYREFFSPVAENVAWMEGEALFSTDINIGNVSLDPQKEQYTSYIQKSVNLSTLALDGEKGIDISLTKQKMYVKIGDTVIRVFPVSTGTAKHPTPPGHYSVLLKQTVRVAGTTPHYIMPLFQEFKRGGFGLHALPSLANDRGVYWREALNHIGYPKSHGCIRLLPEDAKFLWNFTNIGTKVNVRW